MLIDLKHIFILSNQNGDLARYMPFQKRIQQLFYGTIVQTLDSTIQQISITNMHFHWIYISSNG